MSNEQEKLRKTVHIEKGITTRLISQIISTNGETNKLKIKKFVENLPVRDSRHFRTVYTETMPDVDMTSTYTDEYGEGYPPQSVHYDDFIVVSDKKTLDQYLK